MIDEKTQMFRLLDAFPLLVKKATTHSSETTLIYLHNQNVKLNFESFIYIIYINILISKLYNYIFYMINISGPIIRSMCIVYLITHEPSLNQTH